MFDHYGFDGFPEKITAEFKKRGGRMVVTTSLNTKVISYRPSDELLDSKPTQAVLDDDVQNAVKSIADKIESNFDITKGVSFAGNMNLPDNVDFARLVSVSGCIPVRILRGFDVTSDRFFFSVSVAIIHAALAKQQPGE